jgi:uncharacterized protein with HEPN domain
MRDRLIHHYVGIDYEMVWGVVTSKVEELDRAVRAFLEGTSKNRPCRDFLIGAAQAGT